MCGYKTHRKDAFNRHENSNKHITNIILKQHHDEEKAVPNCENTVPKCENTVQNCENTVQNCENTVQNCENVAHNKYNCAKCNKIYKTKKYLEQHNKKCNGIDSLTCPKCMKRFTDSGNKSRHIKKNNCKPISIFQADNVKNIINNNINNNYNTTNNTNNTNITNNTFNNNHITNVYINDYGKERKDYLLTYDNFYDIVKTPNNNILVRYLKSKNFNPLFPENHCIKYENKRFKMKENNKWSLINANALKDKLFYDCGSEVLNVFGRHEDKIKNQITNIDQYQEVRKKSNFFELQLEGSDKEIKDRMLDIVKDDN